MSREQGPRFAGMRPTANGVSRRQCRIFICQFLKEAAS